VVEYLPATQLVHAYKPTLENVPAAQVPHTGPVPVTAVYLPTGQVLQNTEAGIEKSPAAQLEQVDERIALVAAEYKPAAHGVHDGWPMLV